MPMFLPQLSRRKFLKRAALAGATALAPSVYAALAGKPRDPATFFFLSDTHIAADPALKHEEVNMAENLAACAREIAAWPVAPADVIVCGDLAFKTGLSDDYVTCDKYFEPIRAVAPVHLLVGNHDNREGFWNAFPLDITRQATVPRKQAAIFSSAHANWFLLDSLNDADIIAGRLGAAQLDWLARELALRPQKPAIIVCHHNLNQHGGVVGLEDSSAVAELLERQRQVKAFIYGHTHHWRITQHKSGVHLINLPPTAFVFERGRPSGWVRATLAENSLEIELRALDRNHPEHGRVQRLAWRT